MGVERLGMRGVIGRFFARLDAVTAESFANQISVLLPTDQASEEYKWLGMTPPMREWVGGRQARGLRESGVIIRNKLFEATLDIHWDELRRDKSGQIEARVDEFAGRVAEHWAELLTQIIETPGNSYDGVGYFSGAHLEGESGTQDNDLASSADLGVSVAAPGNPTPADIENSITKATQKMLGYKDDQGKPMNGNARRFLVLCPTHFWASMSKALNLPIILEGAQARHNLLVNLGGWGFQGDVNPRLNSATNAFYIFRTDASMKPFIRQEELFESGTEDEIFTHRRVLFGVSALRNVGNAYWQYAAKVTLTT